MNSLIYVDDSQIHGKGLFAAKDIKKGTVIGLAQGKPTNDDGMYVIWIDENTGYEIDCDFRYINHSNKANAVYYDTLEVCAIRDIKAGQEITHNYDGEI